MHDSPIGWMMAGGVRAEDTADDRRHDRVPTVSEPSRRPEARLPRLYGERVRSFLAGPAASPTLDCCPA